MNPVQQQQQHEKTGNDSSLSALHIIREDLTHGDWEKSGTLSVKKMLIQIKEKITGNVIRVRLEWFNDGCRSKLYADLVELIASYLKYFSLNTGICPLDVIKQNMRLGYNDDEDEFVTVSSWLELAHAVCIVGSHPLKLEVCVKANILASGLEKAAAAAKNRPIWKIASSTPTRSWICKWERPCLKNIGPCNGWLVVSKAYDDIHKDVHQAYDSLEDVMNYLRKKEATDEVSVFCQRPTAKDPMKIFQWQFFPMLSTHTQLRLNGLDPNEWMWPTIAKPETMLKILSEAVFSQISTD